MALISIEVNLRLPPETTAAIAALLKKGDKMINDLEQLKTAMAALESKVTEANATLTGLAQAVVDLKNSANVQAGIDELTAKAQQILQSLTTAEDAADDQLPQPPTP